MWKRSNWLSDLVLPLLVALGAAQAASPVRFPITGFLGGSLTKRSVQFG